MNKLGQAIALASDLFKDKVDKQGKPYILHCLHVMNDLHSDDEELNCIAVLHDVPEDTDVTVEDLYNMGFSMRVCSALRLLNLNTDKTISYDEYIRRLSNNPDAKIVKKSDLRHNSNITRLKGLRKKDFERLEKYHKAYVYLSE